MDPVSLGLGLAPICLSAIKGAEYLGKKIKIIGNHQREICRFRKRFKIQAGIFLDECYLLIQDAGTDDCLVEDMVDNFAHSHWASPELEARMKKHLGRRYNDVKDTVNEINTQIVALDEGLGNLEEDYSTHTRASWAFQHYDYTSDTTVC